MLNPHSDITYSWQEYMAEVELNHHSDIAYNWQESLFTVESRFFDHQIGVMLGNQLSWTDDLNWYAKISNITYWAGIRENDRLFREGKSGYSMGDGILRKWGDG